ncbi:MAG: sugar-binding domain-containing protein [bacterium]
MVNTHTGVNYRLIIFILLAGFICIQGQESANAEIDISNNEWHLWLDKKAEWKDDKLYLPPVNINELPVNPPTCGWWELFKGKGKSITLPATVEEHFWTENGNHFGIAGDYVGVSWFTTILRIPPEFKGKHVSLKFGSVRMRAEVFINKKLAGYDLIDGTPFEVDISEFVRFGSDNNLTVRVTDPDGNFNWRDYVPQSWGKYSIPPSHGFGGITDRVVLSITDKIYIGDVFIKNKPSINDVDVQVTLVNKTGEGRDGSIGITIFKAEDVNKPVFEKKWGYNCKPGSSLITKSIKVDTAIPWSLMNPNVYKVSVKWLGDDRSSHLFKRRFGFRWFGIRSVNGDRQFYLNNKRIVLRSAISWGFWPVNGIYPTPELAEKQIRMAKSLGLNMLNFHRAIGQPLVLDKSDELGLLYYEEPGGYKTGMDNEFCRKWLQHKLFRMIKRDRSHPSLVIYNMQNEMGKDPKDYNIKDIKQAHSLDETRMITFTSTNFSKNFYRGNCPKDSAPVKMFMEPYNHKLLYQGYWDHHHAGGYGTYQDRHYNGPKDYLRFSDHKPEIIFYGEEGATSSPARFQLIKEQVLKSGKRGWDGDDYIHLYNVYDKFLNEKKFIKAFPDVDSLCRSLGNVAYYYQGRIIENIRINNIVDGYVINGWEGEKTENHSGIVDCFRNPKGDVELLAYYNQPLYVAVKVRNKIIKTGDNSITDIFLVNEKELKGYYSLHVKADDKKGLVLKKKYKVKIKGGTHFGQLLKDNIIIKSRDHGYINIQAELKKRGKIIARGKDEILAVKLNMSGIPLTGSLLDTSGIIKEFISSIGNFDLKDYKKGVPYGDFLIAGDSKIPLESGDRLQPLLKWIIQGNKLIIIKNAYLWAEYFRQREVADYYGKKTIRCDWNGGGYFVREHPLFDGLPVNCAFNWEYQCLADYNVRWKNDQRYGIRLYAEETVVAAVTDHKPEVLTAVAVIPLGRGHIIISTLDILSALAEQNNPSLIAKRILLNFLRYKSEGGTGVP